MKKKNNKHDQKDCKSIHYDHLAIYLYVYAKLYTDYTIEKHYPRHPHFPLSFMLVSHHHQTILIKQRRQLNAKRC